MFGPKGTYFCSMSFVVEEEEEEAMPSIAEYDVAAVADAAAMERMTRITQLMRIRGRFDGRPQRCSHVIRLPSGAMNIAFELESREDGRRTLTLTVPAPVHLRACGECDVAVRSSNSSDGHDAGYYGAVRLSEDGYYVELRIDNTIRPSFWMSADLTALYM